MSDFFRNDPSQEEPFDGAFSPNNGLNRWERPDPFAVYDDPPEASPANLPENDFSAWRRPDSPPSPSFLTDEPAPYGAEMQQGGVPLYTLGAETPFGIDGGDAPTRIGMPAVSPQQMVSKRKTINRSERPAFAPPSSGEGLNPPAPEASQHPEVIPSYQPYDSSAPAAHPEATPTPPARSRRVSRLARYQENTTPAQDVEMAASLAEPPSNPRRTLPLPRGGGFPPSSIPAPTEIDPFEAGDNVAKVPQVPAGRRPALPGERYTGARTAIPQSGAPIPRHKVGELPEYDLDEPPLQNRTPQGRERMKEQNATEQDFGLTPRPQGVQIRPAQGMPPQRLRPPEDIPAQGRPPQTRLPQDHLAQGAMPPQGRPPMDQGRRPQDPARRPSDRPLQERSPQAPASQERRPQTRPPQNRPLQERPAQNQGFDREFEAGSESYAPSREDEQFRASVKRPRYDFEEEDDFDDHRRRRGCLMPILIVLLVAGLLLAGLCLPNWDAMEGGIASALGGIKTSITETFDTVKNMIFPVEEKITSFSVSPAEGTAPVDLVFNVQTSLSVTDLRIVDDAGEVVTQKTLTDADLLTNEVTKNSKAMIWRLRYSIPGPYSGLYTVQSLQSDGAWDEGMPLAAPVSIAAPIVPEPPIQDFACDTSEDSVPTTVGFTVQTSGDVVAVRIVDRYETAVVTHSLTDEETGNASVVESSEGLTWELTVDVNEPYEGNYLLQYQTVSDLSFNTSAESAYVELTAVEEPATGDETDDLTSKGEEGADDDAVIAANADADLDSDLDPDADADSDSDTDPAVDSQPIPTVAPTQTPEPEATALPKLTAVTDESADPSAISLKATIYNEQKTTKTYSRSTPISLLGPNYAIWDQSGVLTFRGGPLRQNAAYGFVQLVQESFAELWKVPVGSTKLSKSTVYGIVWPGQPVIVKWPTELRNLMEMYPEKKEITGLREVILGGQDGKIYFLNLTDGTATRDAIDLGAPSSGGASIATNAAPILGIGQSHGNLAGKQVNNGYHLINLLTNKELMLLSSRDKAANSNYTGVSGAALFDNLTGSMIVGSQNGLLYTAELGDRVATFDHMLGTLKLPNLATQRYKTLASKQDKKNTNIDGSVAMYGSYVFYGDEAGVLQCVDVNTLTPIWAVKTGDNIDSTPALDLEDGETLALYTANTIQSQGKKGVCTIRRYNALTGEQIWEYQVPELAYTTEFKIGCMASPVIGEKAISDLVIFTATNGKLGSSVIALKKSNGTVAWETKMESESLSSPVAVYDESGRAWIVQAESNGNVHLLNAETGAVISTLQLEGEIQGSPAIYRNIMVLGTTGKDSSFIYGIQLQ